MRISDIQFGHFPEFAELNPNVPQGSLSLRLAVDTGEPHVLPRQCLPRSEHFESLLPSLSLHRCGQSECGRKSGAGACSQTSILFVDDEIDLAHLVEHLIIAIQSDLGGLRRCSGVTCQMPESVRQFFVYVECDDPVLAVFAINAAVAMMNQQLYLGRIDCRFRTLFDWIRGLDRKAWTRTQIAEWNAWTDVQRQFCVNALSSLQFFAAGPLARNGGAAVRPKRILVVDDDAGFCEATQGMLALEGYSTETVTNFAEAAAALRARDFDLLIIDIYLPGIAGHDFAQQLLPVFPFMPIVLISGDQGIADTKIPLRSIEFLAKPFRPDDLVSAIVRTYNFGSPPGR